MKYNGVCEMKREMKLPFWQLAAEDAVKRTRKEDAGFNGQSPSEGDDPWNGCE
jgi:hypothetical protein